jgi:hypothetical protein
MRGVPVPEFARFSTFEVDSSKVDDAISFFKGTDLKDAADANGFRRGFWLLDRDTGKGAELVIFDSKASLDAAEDEEERDRERANAVGISLGSEQVYEVVAEGRHP